MLIYIKLMEIGIKTSARTLFLGLSLLKISPVNFWFNSISNLCKTTYGRINLRLSTIYRSIMVNLFLLSTELYFIPLK